MAKKTNLSIKELLIIVVPAVILIIIGFWVASKFISPAPPDKIILTSGSESGAYYHFAKLYRDELAKEKIQVEILPSSGSIDNVQRLLKGEADVAFVQGGTAESNEQLDSLGSLYYEPVWIFLNTQVKAEQLNDLSKLRIATGAKGSGTAAAANELLDLNDIKEQSVELLSLSNAEAAKRLLEHQIDVAFFVSSPKSPLVQKLLRDSRVRLLNQKRASAYSHLLPFLSKIILANGIIDLQKNIPPRDITLLAPTANLVVQKNLHSAIQVLLLEAAKKIHGGASIFYEPGTFPSTENTVFPVSEIAERYYKVGPPFLMRYLPFSVAIFLDRMVVMLIPLVALMLPLMKIVPPLYRWRIRSSILKRYKKLQHVDDESFGQEISEERYNGLVKELDQIEEEANNVKTPVSYADQVYNQLLHIDLVKKKLDSLKRKPEDSE